MTTIAINYSRSLLSILWNGLKKTLQGIMIGWMIARQTQANQHVAKQLIQHGEYRQDDYYTLVAKLNQETIQSIHKEFGNND